MQCLLRILSMANDSVVMSSWGPGHAWLTFKRYYFCPRCWPFRFKIALYCVYASPGFCDVSNENVVSNDVTDDWTLLHSHSHSCATFRPAGLLPISGNQSDDRTQSFSQWATLIQSWPRGLLRSWIPLNRVAVVYKYKNDTSSFYNRMFKFIIDSIGLVKTQKT